MSKDTSNPRKVQPSEVSEQGGLRRFLLAVLAAVLIGMLLRVSLSPSKIEKMIRTKLESSSIRENVVFSGAEVSLADGLLPDLAVVLRRVEWRTGNQCSTTAPIRASAVRIPIRWSSFIGGRLAAGNVKIDDLTVDLDEFKHVCRPVASTLLKVDNSSKEILIVNESTKTPNLAVGEIWSTADQKMASSLLTGVRVSRAEVFFEGRMKSVVIEDATALWRGEDLDVSTSLRFPPATVFGEQLPMFAINGTVKQSEMIAEIRAELNEGNLEANAIFKPVLLSNGAKELDADLKLSVVDIPLSVITPVLTKSGIVSGAFQPKFMWLDCGAEIHGVFSRLFVDNPVLLKSCSVSGQVGRVELKEAIRLPGGEWTPFQVAMQHLDIARVLDTFDVPGPTGVFANFGQFDGSLSFESTESIHASGRLGGAVLRFAGGEGVALQPLAVGQLEASLLENRWKLSMQDFKPDGGEADLTLKGELGRNGNDAKVDLQLKHLKLNSRVEKVIFTGPVKDISGTASLASKIDSQSGKTTLTKLSANILLQQMRGTELAADEIKIESKLISGKKDASNRDIQLIARAAKVEVLKSSHLFRLLKPTLLGWSGELAANDNELILRDVNILGKFEEDGFHWSQADATVGKILKLTSHGLVFRDHAVSAEVEARYPIASRLRWTINGTWMKPKYDQVSPELVTLFVKAGLPQETVTGEVPLSLLGIPSSVIRPERD